MNFDQQAGLRFTRTVEFPVADRNAEIVYSSHCLEHLDDATVDQVLAEARRMCSGSMVLKLPDFEEVLRRWKAGDDAYFQHWGMNGVAHTWPTLNVKDTIDARASMIFCGWWNDRYGDEWGKRTPDANGAYHGPAAPLAKYMGEMTPHAISAALVASIGGPGARHFNHQNAWSREELRMLLERHGFDVLSWDAEEAFTLPIPGIREMEGISMYAVCG